MSLNPATDFDNERKITVQTLLQDFRFLVDDYLPEAQFWVGGGLRFDALMLSLKSYMHEHIRVRQLNQVMGVMPCRWSLSWHRNQSQINDSDFCRLLEIYAANSIAFTLCFDNPFITDEMLEDPYGLGLVQELIKRDRLNKNTLCVANDKLRARIKKEHPKLKIIAHPNRIIIEQQRRTAKLYKQLLGQYDMVALHPSDGGRAEILSGIAQGDSGDEKRIIITTNDPCLRTCPARREHLQALAGMREQPYHNIHRVAEAQIVDKVGCKKLDNIMSQSAMMSYDQKRKAYELGYRHFAFQAQRHLSPFTLASDVLNGIFTKAPEYSNKVATVTANVLSALSMSGRQQKSGMLKFNKLY